MQNSEEKVKIPHQQTESHARWRKMFDSERCDKRMFRFLKGRKEYYHEQAKKLGYESFNQFVLDAVDEKIKGSV